MKRFTMGFLLWVMLSYIVIKFWFQAVTEPTFDQLAIILPIVILGIPVAINVIFNWYAQHWFLPKNGEQ
jgi:hypothetical protein